MKGPTEDISAAENAIKLLGGKLEEDISYELNGEKRRIVKIICSP